MVEISSTPMGVEFLRTPRQNFDDIADFPYTSNFVSIDGLQYAYIDEGPRDAPVVLMVHGMPTWSYLYRHMIRGFLDAGLRCVAPDHIGFGRSDKVVSPEWYSIARHADNLRMLIEELDLQDVILVVQDWGGPIGLSQYADMPERFTRLVIMNTWLHHDSYEYSEGTLSWIDQNSPGGLFRENVPKTFNWGTMMLAATSRALPQDSMFAELNGESPSYSPAVANVKRAYDAPFVGLGEPGVAGPRRFPLSIPARGTNPDNASRHSQIFDVVNATTLPTHFVWGIHDNVFTRDWGRSWHSMIPHSTWHELDARHFLQDTHGAEIATHIVGHITRT